MSHLRSSLRCRLAVSLAAAVLLREGVSAQTTNTFLPSSSHASEFTFTLVPGEAVGNEPVIRALVRSGTNEFIFVVPDGLRAQAAGSGTVVMVGRDMGFSVSVRVLGSAPPRSGLAEALEEQIRRRHPRVSGLEAFTTTVADQEGTGIQLRETLAGLNPRHVRVLWVPFKAGLIEFALNADSAYASAGQTALDMVLLTFRFNEVGKLNIVRRSDKT